MPRPNAARTALATLLTLGAIAGALALPAPVSAASYPEVSISKDEVVAGETFTVSGSGCFRAEAPWDTPFASVIAGGFAERTRVSSDGTWSIEVHLGDIATGSWLVQARCVVTGADDYPPATVTLVGRDTFADVPPGAPFARDIEWLAATRITSGDARPTMWSSLQEKLEYKTTFRPKARVTRQAMAVFMYRFTHPGTTDNGLAMPPVPPRCWRAPYPDVPSRSPYCGSITWLGEAGITRGTSDGRFAPLGTITRQAMAAFLYHLEHGGAAPPRCTSAAFADVPAGSPFCGSIAWLSSTGLTSSDPAGNFGPTTPVTREMMAAFLHRHAVNMGGLL